MELPYQESRRRLRALRAKDNPVDKLIQQLEESCNRERK
jgi:hypothetical protein